MIGSRGRAFALQGESPAPRAATKVADPQMSASSIVPRSRPSALPEGRMRGPRPTGRGNALRFGRPLGQPRRDIPSAKPSVGATAAQSRPTAKQASTTWDARRRCSQGAPARRCRRRRQRAWAGDESLAERNEIATPAAPSGGGWLSMTAAALGPSGQGLRGRCHSRAGDVSEAGSSRRTRAGAGSGPRRVRPVEGLTATAARPSTGTVGRTS